MHVENYCCNLMQGHTNNPECRVEQCRPSVRNRLFIARETGYDASCSTPAQVAAGAIHHTTMRPRVQGNWEQETYRLLPACLYLCVSLYSLSPTGNLPLCCLPAGTLQTQSGSYRQVTGKWRSVHNWEFNGFVSSLNGIEIVT